MNTVLFQEITRYNRLTLQMKKDCEDLIKAVAGKIVMSEDLEKVGD